MPTYENLARLDLTYDEDAPRMPTREGIELYYESRGEGVPITFLNHFGVTTPMWRVFTEELVQHHRLVTYDLCNHGHSTRVKEEPTWEEHAVDLIALLDALEIESTYLVGASSTTVFARDLALWHPDRVRGLILAGPVFGPRGMRRQRQLQRNLLRTLADHGPAGMFDHFYPEVFSSDMNETLGTPGFLGFREAFMSFTSPEELANGLNRAAQDNHSPDLPPRISAPTIIIAGDDDMLLSPTGARELAEQFPNGSYEIIPRAGHQPFVDDAEGFQSIIHKFVRDVESNA